MNDMRLLIRKKLEHPKFFFQNMYINRLHVIKKNNFYSYYPLPIAMYSENNYCRTVLTPHVS